MRGKCISCGEQLGTDPILHLSNMPKQVQNLQQTDACSRNEATIGLNLKKCPECCLVQFDCDPVDYYRDVIRARGVSSKMLGLHRKQLVDLMERYGLQNKSFWEVGCGEGDILAMAQQLPWNVYGTEHSTELVNAARSRRLKVERGYVSDVTYRSSYGPFDAFATFNYLEHQPNPFEVLRGIRANLHENAVGIINVPNFEYIVEYGAYYELMRDHIAYYDVQSLTNLLYRAGFSVKGVSVFNEDTLSVEVSVKKTTVREFGQYAVSQQSRLSNQLRAFCSNYGGRAAVWGASHQCFTILATMNLNSSIVGCVVDSASFKWGHRVPGTDIPIVSPESLSAMPDVSKIIIVAPGYADEIRRQVSLLRPDISAVASISRGCLEMMRADSL